MKLRPGPVSAVGRASLFKSSDPSLIQQKGILCDRGNKNAQKTLTNKNTKMKKWILHNLDYVKGNVA